MVKLGLLSTVLVPRPPEEALLIYTLYLGKAYYFQSMHAPKFGLGNLLIIALHRLLRGTQSSPSARELAI